MSVTAAKAYFLRLEEFPHRELFEGLAHVWEAIRDLEAFTRKLVEEPGLPEGTEADLKGLRVEDGLIACEGLFLSRRRFRVARAGVRFEPGVRIEPGVVVKGPSVLCAEAELRHGAYLRGSCLIGPKAIVGHATEVKNSLFLNHAEAGHFAYVGDSLLGAHANLGAGTKLANLQLRTEEEKHGSAKPRSIRIRVEGETFDTRLRKFGAVVGDDAEIGCNAVTSPGTLLGPGCWVTPNANVPKGIYPPAHLIRSEASRVEVAPRSR